MSLQGMQTCSTRMSSCPAKYACHTEVCKDSSDLPAGRSRQLTLYVSDVMKEDLGILSTPDERCTGETERPFTVALQACDTTKKGHARRGAV